MQSVAISMSWVVRLLFGSRRAKAKKAPTTRAAPRKRLATGEVKGRCHVIDGDTIVIGGQHIRLAGIDAPELDRPYGQNAKWALVELCKGRTVRAVPTSDTSYERIVASCYLDDGRDLSAEMVRLGMALDWPKFSGGKYRTLEPPGIRKKLFEKARVVSIRHDETLKTVGSILANGVEVRAHCFNCDLTLEVSPELLHAAYGDGLRLIGRTSPCRRVGCEGKAIFFAKCDGEFVPLL